MLAPKIMVFAVALGSVTSFCFVIVLLFTLKDIDTVISSASGPLLQIYYQATSSRTGATCLLIFNIGAMAFATRESYFTLGADDQIDLFVCRGTGHDRIPSGVFDGS